MRSNEARSQGVNQGPTHCACARASPLHRKRLCGGRGLGEEGGPRRRRRGAGAWAPRALCSLPSSGPSCRGSHCPVKVSASVSSSCRGRTSGWTGACRRDSLEAGVSNRRPFPAPRLGSSGADPLASLCALLRVETRVWLHFLVPGLPQLNIPVLLP